MDKASVEQRALINKLADEYADELKGLGVRVDTLENKVGNIRVYGDAFVRFRYQQAPDQHKNWGKEMIIPGIPVFVSAPKARSMTARKYPSV